MTTAPTRRRVTAAVAVTALTPTFAVLTAIVLAVGGTPPPAAIASALDIPAVALDAYQRAAQTPEAEACGLRWQILAGIGRVESNHAANRHIAEDGTVTPPIIGPALDGTGPVARVDDTDTGALDGDTVWDHAVGPMQFLPTSWRTFGIDTSGDGGADPQNLYDTVAAAAAHLCRDRNRPLTDTSELEAALLAYNPSDAYVADVLGWITHYDNAELDDTAPAGTPTGTIVNVRGIQVDQRIADHIEALLEAAARDGLTLHGTGHRTHEQQIALRRAHCGTSHHAIYEMPPGSCSPPTARPGESMHEQGLAIDFTCNGRLVSATDECFDWLNSNAHTYGLLPLRSEPWHWSVNGL